MKKQFASILVVLAFSLAVQAQAPAFQAQKGEALAIMQDLPLYLEVSRGTLKYKESLVVGDKLTLLNKTWKFKVDGNEREYIRVRAPSGTEGWVRSSYAVPKSQLAAVKAGGATVYSEPRDVKMTTKSISAMVLVASLAEGSTPAFAKVVCYDPFADKYYTDPVFVSKNDLSYDDSDISSLVMYMSARSAKDKALKAKFLANIEKNYQGSIFLDAIREALSPDGAQKPVSAVSGSFLVNDDKVNVRSAPDEAAGQVVGQLKKGDAVKAVEATTKSYTVGGQTAQWYRIEAPAGWVFGAFLDAE